MDFKEHRQENNGICKDICPMIRQSVSDGKFEPYKKLLPNATSATKTSGKSIENQVGIFRSSQHRFVQ